MVSAAFRNMAVQEHVFNSAMGVSVSIPGLSSVSSMAVPAVLLAVFAAAFGFAALLRRAGGSKEREVPTWLCGYQDLHDGTRYRDKSMFAALKNLLYWTGGNVK